MRIAKIAIPTLVLTMMLSGCSMVERCANKQPWFIDNAWYSDTKYADERYCEIPAVAHTEYRIPPWYSEYTKPEEYFYHLPQNPKPDTINILALGDSWFAYPKRGFFFDFWSTPRNLLSSMTQVSHPSSYILSLSNGGEIITNIAGLAVLDPEESLQRKHVDHSIPWVTARVLRRMNEISNENKTPHKFNYIIISGGGNDLYPARIRRIIKQTPCEYKDGEQKEAPGDRTPIPICINQEETAKFLARVRTAYQTLLKSLRSELKNDKKVKFITHTYDQIFPMPIGAQVLFAPFTVSIADYGWFYPTLEEFGITDRVKQREITNYLLMEFQKMLIGLSLEPEYRQDFIVVETQGVMETAFKREHPEKVFPKDFPVDEYWLNEIHPTPKGYRCIIEKIHQRIREDMQKQDPELKLDAPNYECLK